MADKAGNTKERISKAKAKAAKAKVRAVEAKVKAAEVKAKAREGVVARGVAKHGSGFADFIRGRGIVGMAIGLAIGTVASGTVKDIVEGFVTPLVQFIVGSQASLETQQYHLDLWGRQADFQWGLALSSSITLVATIFVVYILVKAARLDKFDK